MSGSIDEPDSVESWSFTALRDEVYSFYVQAEDNLDPILTLSGAGSVISNDDYDYPSTRNSLLEAVTIPASGTYILEISSYGSSTGDYTLTMLPGYAEVLLEENFSSLAGWSAEDSLTTEVVAGSLNLSLIGIEENASIANRQTSSADVFYAGVDVQAIESVNTWTVGIALHRQSNGDYYFFAVNQRGEWRFTLVQDGQERPIRDWVVHPSIQAGETEFSLGVLALDNHFELFYDNQLLGNAEDDTLAEPGGVGIAMTTADALSSEITAQFDDVLVTTPLDLDSVPSELLTDNATLTVHELERRRIIPAGGRQVLNVGESFFERRSPGVDLLPLGRGTTFTNFALSTTTTIEAADGTAGCGLAIQNVGDTAYTVAFLDNTGGFGVSRRDDETFADGIYDQNTAWGASQPNNLLLIATDETLHYYINGYHVGTLPLDPVEGEVGNTIINFDPIDARCEFTDTWLWTWE